MQDQLMQDQLMQDQLMQDWCVRGFGCCVTNACLLVDKGLMPVSQIVHGTSVLLIYLDP